MPFQWNYVMIYQNFIGIGIKQKIIIKKGEYYWRNLKMKRQLSSWRPSGMPQRLESAVKEIKRTIENRV